jgi:hypothetical protein
MFDSLADTMKADDRKEGVTNTERLARLALVLAISFVVFGGLYLGVRLLE